MQQRRPVPCERPLIQRRDPLLMHMLMGITSRHKQSARWLKVSILPFSYKPTFPIPSRQGTIQSMSSASILGPGGTIAQRLSNYEARVQQLDMAEAVAQAIADK